MGTSHPTNGTERGRFRYQIPLKNPYFQSAIKSPGDALGSVQCAPLQSEIHFAGVMLRQPAALVVLFSRRTVGLAFLHVDLKLFGGEGAAGPTSFRPSAAASAIFFPDTFAAST